MATSKKLKRLTSGQTFADLERLEDTEAQTKRRPPHLPLESINVAPNAFQRRLKNEKLLEDKQFVWDLVSAIELVSADEQSQPFAPILVTAVGNKYFVVDGHHRLDAYHTAGWRRPVPVQYFEGTLRKARAEALERNTKHGLRMTPDAKAEAAWELVIENKLKRSEISKHTTVPIRTVARMRAVLKEYRDKVKDLPWARARRLTWAKDLEFAADGKHPVGPSRFTASVPSPLICTTPMSRKVPDPNPCDRRNEPFSRSKMGRARSRTSVAVTSPSKDEVRNKRRRSPVLVLSSSHGSNGLWRKCFQSSVSSIGSTTMLTDHVSEEATSTVSV